MANPLKTFIIYSSLDRKLRDEFLQHLKPLAKARKIQVWSDAEIPPGEPWNHEIQEKLLETELFIPLISKNFFNSEYIENIELPFAEDQRTAGRAFVIPILLNPCGYKYDPIIGQLEVIPKDKPITSASWESEDHAWEHVIDKISGRADQILVDKNFLKKREEIIAEKQAAAQKLVDEQKRKQEEKERARLADEAKILEEKRIAAEKEIARLAAEKKERERIAAEKETARLAAEKKERERIAAEKEAARLAAEKKERERIENERLAAQKLTGEMVFVKGGTFKMGSNEYSDEQPIHDVAISDFWIGKYQVTNQQFCQFLNEKGNQNEGGAEWINLDGSWGAEKCRIRKNGQQFSVEAGFENHPVIYVSWFAATAFCAWLSQKTGKIHALPTEAQWEFTARGGTVSNNYKFAGSNEVKDVAWFWENSGDKILSGTWEAEKVKNNNCKSHPVGQKKANELGLFDMSGNVWEWCADVWHDNYQGAPANGSAWTTGGNQERRVCRGGSWSLNDLYCRSSIRYYYNGTVRYNDVGFRVARHN